MGLSQSSDHSKVGHSKAGHSEVGHSKVNHLELGAKRASPVPSREASEDCSGAAYDGEIPDQGCFDSHQEQIDEVIWRLLQDHDRMNSGRRYCYLVGLGLNCKFIYLLFKHSVIKFIKISSHLDSIVSEIIYNQTDTLTQRLMDLR